MSTAALIIYRVLFEINVKSGKTNPGETTAQFAFQVIESGHLKTKEKNFELKTVSWKHGFGSLRSPRWSGNAN